MTSWWMWLRPRSPPPTGRDLPPSDTADRLPRRVIVRSFDVFAFAFGIFSYVADVATDLAVAYCHYANDRVWQALLIFGLFLLPSLLLNAVSLSWLLDDGQFLSPAPRRSRLFPCSMKALACFFQLGPCIWHLDALHWGVRCRAASSPKEEHSHYARMICAERDASLLRVFSAFLESVPQMLVQGYIAGLTLSHLPTETALPHWVRVQCASLFFSLLSVCWTLSIQHRSLRITRPDKLNMRPLGSLLQLLWRLLTVFARYLSFVLFALAFHYWILLVCLLHYLASLLVLSVYQVPDSTAGERLVLLPALAAVHLFAPLNVLDGPSRWRYALAYSVEAVENAILILSSLLSPDFHFPFKWHLASLALCTFSSGLCVMGFYYAYCHPTRRCKTLEEREDAGRLNSPVRVVDSQFV